MTHSKDSIYASPLADIEAFKFDDKVAEVFPDMIQRSVPGYQAIIGAIGLLAGRFAKPYSNCYDLGCSLGAATFSMLAHIRTPECRIVAVDNSEAMVLRFRERLSREAPNCPVEIICADIRDTPIENASLVVLNFTLQFIPIDDRLAFLGKIQRGLQPGGLLILSEKLRFDDIRQQDLQTEMHHAFKLAQGYSKLEISQKRSALENVLIPENFKTHQNRLLEAGFSTAEVWFQYFNFASILALK